VPFGPSPPVAAFRHRDAREGFEVVCLRPDGDGWRVAGQTAAVEDGVPWAVAYDVLLDAAWRTRRARVIGLGASGGRVRMLECDPDGRWRVDGAPAPALHGCADVDLEASACTNAFPVRRLALEVGAGADAPAAYVRAAGLAVERLEQRYARLEDGDGG